jgi:hypothetical protein
MMATRTMVPTIMAVFCEIPLLLTIVYEIYLTYYDI